MYTVLLNPESGRGAALRQLADVEALLRRRGIEYQVMRAESPEEATRIARSQAEAQAEGVIALGGDGTLFRIVNGMAGSDVPLLFVPCGTGNDFIKSLNLPKDPSAALQAQLDSPISRIDVGRMNETCFLNVSGTGFDVDVLRFADRYKSKYGGLKPYLLGLYDAMRMYHPTMARLSIDDGPETDASFALISIGNGKYFGGGMKAVPTADVRDAFFDVVTVKPVKKAVILPLLAFYIPGKHVDMKLATLHRCKKLTIRCKGMTLNLDGELLQADEANFELLPAALAVRIPG